ncbi:MAG: alpha/beta hydrolase [Myxococcota bacterium]
MAVPVSPENSTNVRAEERDPAFRAWVSEVAGVIDERFTLDEAPGVRGRAPGGGVAGAAPPPQEPNQPNVPRSKRPAVAVPWYVRAGFATLGTVSPGVASVWAEQLFCTPPRYPVPPAEAAALATAHAGSVVVNGHRLATWTWGQGPTVLLVHGWGGRGGQLAGVVPGLLAAGYSVVAFDGPGHGASEGRRSSLVEMARAVAGVGAALPSRVVGAITHSMGGAATAIAMEGFVTDAPLDLDAAVFIAPPFAASHWVAPFAEALGLPDKVRDGMVRRVEDRLHVRLEDLTMARTAPRMSTPLLVIHDADDKEVPHAAGAGIVARWAGARLHTTNGLGHKRILADADVIARAVGFLAER